MKILQNNIERNLDLLDNKTYYNIIYYSYMYSTKQNRSE